MAAIQMTGKLISWLAARGHLGESLDYWRQRLREPGPRGGKHKGTRIAQVLYIENWNTHTGELLSGLQTAVSARPCRLNFNSVKPARKAIKQLDALRRATDAENNKAQSLRGGAPSSADPGGAQMQEHAWPFL